MRCGFYKGERLVSRVTLDSACTLGIQGKWGKTVGVDSKLERAEKTSKHSLERRLRQRPRRQMVGHLATKKTRQREITHSVITPGNPKKENVGNREKRYQVTLGAQGFQPGNEKIRGRTTVKCLWSTLAENKGGETPGARKIMVTSQKNIRSGGSRRSERKNGGDAFVQMVKTGDGSKAQPGKGGVLLLWQSNGKKNLFPGGSGKGGGLRFCTDRAGVHGEKGE